MNVGTHRTPDGHVTLRLGAGQPRLRRLTAGGVVTALLLAPLACGGSNGGTGGLTNITVAIPPAVSGIDVYAAQAQGYFTQHRLKAKIKTVNGGSASCRPWRPERCRSASPTFSRSSKARAGESRNRASRARTPIRPPVTT